MDFADLRLVGYADTTEDAVESFVDSMMLAAQANTVRLVADAQDGHAVVHAMLGGVLWTFGEKAATEAMLGLRKGAAMLGDAELRQVAKRLHLKIRQAGTMLNGSPQ